MLSAIVHFFELSPIVRFLEFSPFLEVILHIFSKSFFHVIFQANEKPNILSCKL